MTLAARMRSRNIVATVKTSLEGRSAALIPAPIIWRYVTGKPSIMHLQSRIQATAIKTIIGDDDMPRPYKPTPTMQAAMNKAFKSPTRFASVGKSTAKALVLRGYAHYYTRPVRHLRNASIYLTREGVKFAQTGE